MLIWSATSPASCDSHCESVGAKTLLATVVRSLAESGVVSPPPKLMPALRSVSARPVSGSRMIGASTIA